MQSLKNNKVRKVRNRKPRHDPESPSHARKQAPHELSTKASRTCFVKRRQYIPSNHAKSKIKTRNNLMSAMNLNRKQYII